MSYRKTIGILGGGLLGMTLSLRLAKQGFKVTLLETAERTGGLASPCKIGDYTWDQFYHVILLSDANLLHLLEELNLKDQIHWRRTKTGFYADGRLYSMSNLFEFLKFPPLALLDRLRLGFTIFYASRVKDWERLEGIRVTDWLTRLSGKRTFEKIWLPLLKSKLGENYRLASASFIWAIIARMYAARRSGLKQEMFGYVDGGYATILSQLRKALNEAGVQILCGIPVVSIVNNNGHPQVKIAAGANPKFDELILTVSCKQISNLCPGLSSQEKRRLDEVNYQGIVCGTFIVKKPLAGYYVTNITDPRVPFTGIIEMTAVVDKNNFGGNSLIYLPRYLTREDPVWRKDDEEIEGEFLGALESIYPAFSRKDVLASKITRDTGVLPLTTLDYSKKLLPPMKTSMEHVFIVNSAQIPNGTMNVNEIVGLANKKSKEIVELAS